MPTFNDSENRLMHQPAGDYVFTVVGLEKKLVSSGKNAGAAMDALKLEITSKKGDVSTLYDNLIDSPKTAWKYDVFIKSAGVKLAKGQPFELTDDPQAPTDINPLGLRGWCHVRLVEYPPNSGKMKNEIEVYYTNREKLPSVEVQTEDTAQAADDAAFGQAPVSTPEPAKQDDEFSDDIPF